MANQTYLANIDEQKVEELLEQTKENAAYFTVMTERNVKAYSADLDALMEDLYRAVTQPDEITTDGVERYYAELTNMVYFMGEKIEKLNVYSDMSKAAAKEIYNKAFLTSATEKDEKGKSLRTVAENTAIAESASQYESVVSSIYDHTYKTLKMKVDAATEMITTLKNILKRRVQEEYLSSSTSNMKSNINTFSED